MKTKTGIKAWAVNAALRTAIGITQILPVDLSLQLAKLLSKGWILLTTRHLDLAIKHIEASFPGKYSRVEVERIARRCLSQWTMFAMEVGWAPRLLSPATWHKYIKLVDFDEALELLLSNRGTILVAGHYGQFEMTAYLLAVLGLDVVAVMRPLDNAYFNRYVVESRRSHGLELLYKKGAIASSVKIISSGRALALVADQDAGSKGMFVDFFGRPASTYKSIALLAMRTKAPIIVGYARRIGDCFRYEVGAQRIIYPHEWENRDDPLRWITQSYTTAIEEMVREHPEQYLWIHRRWKSQPQPGLEVRSRIRTRRRKAPGETGRAPSRPGASPGPQERCS